MITAQLPDGTQLQFPDNTAQEVIQGAVHRHLGVKAAPPVADPSTTGIPRTIVDQGFQGLTFGFGDEISDRVGAFGASLATGEKYDDLLTEARANTKQRLPAQFKENPLTSIASNVIGGGITGGAGVRALQSANPLLAGALQNYAGANPYTAAAGISVASGALYGAGTGSGSLKERAPDALLGGGLGLLAGPASTYVGRNYIAPLASKVGSSSPVQFLTQSLSKNPPVAAAEQSLVSENPFAANLLKQNGEYFSKTAGQRTQNANLQRLENDARAGTLTKESENAIRQADVQQNREFYSYINNLTKGLDKGGDPNVLIEGVSDVIKKSAKTANAGVNSAYDLAREGKGVKIDSSDIRQGLWSNIAGIRRENVYDLSQMPKATGVIKRLAGYSRQGADSNISSVKLGELENWRKQATNALNSSQDPTERRFLGQMVRGYDDFMENTAANAIDIGDANAIKAFRDAVSQRRNYGQLFESNKFVNDIVTGQKSIDDTVKSLMGTGAIKGRTEMANNLDAILKASGGGSHNVQDDLRQAFTLNAFKRSIAGYEPNNPNVEMISPAKLKTELENLFIHQSKFAEKLYGKDAVASVRKAIKELNLISTSQAGVKNPSGSGEWLGRFLKVPGINRIPGVGLAAKAVEAQKQHVQGSQVTKGLTEFLQEQARYTSPYWSIVPPVSATAATNRGE